MVSARFAQTIIFSIKLGFNVYEHSLVKQIRKWRKMEIVLTAQFTKDLIKELTNVFQYNAPKIKSF